MFFQEGTLSKMNDELVEFILNLCVVELQEEEAEKEKEEELADEKVGTVFFTENYYSILSVMIMDYHSIYEFSAHIRYCGVVLILSALSCGFIY